MLTKEQEEYLARFADIGIAEEANIANRNAQIEKEVANHPLIEAKQIELRAIKDAEYEVELQAFKDSLKS